MKNQNALIGLVIVSIVSLLAIAAPWIAPYDPATTSVRLFEGPSAQHWLGTDQLGRDIFSRILYGARVSLLIGAGSALVAGIIGVPIGLAAGYLGRTVDMIAMQFINLFIALPGLVLALIIIAMTGATMLNIILVLGFVAWPGMARLARGQTFAIRESVYVEAARAVGACNGCSVRDFYVVEPQLPWFGRSTANRRLGRNGSQWRRLFDFKSVHEPCPRLFCRDHNFRLLHAGLSRGIANGPECAP